MPKLKIFQSPSGNRFVTREHVFQLLSILLVIILSILIFINRDKVVALGVAGYLGIFLFCLIGSASIVVPLPGLFVVTTMGAVLDPFLVGVVSGLGGTIGELSGYFLGYGGRITVENSRVYVNMVSWMKKWGNATIFFLALIPNPFFDVAGAVAGLLRFPVWKFLAYGALGRIPKHVLFAYLGYWGISLL